MRNKNLLTGAIIVVVVLIAAGVLLAMRKSDNTKTASSSASSSSTPSMDMSQQQPPSPANDQSNSTANSVTIKDFAFNPGTTTVKVGTKVTWTNQDSIGHTVTADTPSADAPASGSIGQGQSYSFTFNKAGTYNYHCTPHPYMKGTVVVTE
jgi:amicyanin